MKRVSLLVIFLMSLWSCTAFAEQIKGRITYYNDIKDIAVVETNMGYTVMEIYSYEYIESGDVVIGNFHSYGFTDMYNVTKESSTRIYIEEYWLNGDQVLDWIARK